MIPRTCRRLAEVDFPIAKVSRHATREKSIRHGHPSTLHLWWARRPLASSRAVLLALLLPDPCDKDCPDAFTEQARALLSGTLWNPGRDSSGLQHALLEFIADFANWDNAAKSYFLKIGCGLVKAAHAETPLVVDPFAGGGSIPLEALRLGCDAFASGLNPVACLILKVMLEDIPRSGPELADELRRVGGEIKAQAEQELADLYPADADGAKPIAYLWARTVRCESPNCGAEIPLMRSLWLCKKPKRKWALRAKVVRPKGKTPRVEFEIFEPGGEKEVAGGTVTRAKATCLCCETVLPPERVRAQLSAEKGGADVVFDDNGARTGGARMTAVVTLKPGEQGRHYRLPTEVDYVVVRESQRRLRAMLDEWERGGSKGLCPVPDEKISLNEIRRISIPLYGIKSWGDIFTMRQKVVLMGLLKQIMRIDSPCRNLLAIALNRTADGSASLSPWLASGEEVKHVFMRQALGIVWDFGESNYCSDASRSWSSAVSSVAKVIEAWPKSGIGQVQSASAIDHPLPDETASVWFTDPPYYDAVPYAHLSDFFFVWLNRSLPDYSHMRDLFSQKRGLTPKEEEIVVDRPHELSDSKKNTAFYESGMERAFIESRRVLREDGIGSVVFAHKTTEGWEAMLSGMVRGGWTITGSWPIATEMPTKVGAANKAILLTSVHLICRPRPVDAPVGEWTEVLHELPMRVGKWMERLQNEGVHGADLVFACIGPALEIFSRHRAVEKPDGRTVNLAEYLERVWEEVSRIALGNILGTAEAQARNGGAGALEEDARLTALFLWTLQATAIDNGAKQNGGERDDESESGGSQSTGFSCPYDLARRFAQPMGIELANWESRIIETKKGVVRLLPVGERAKQLFGEDSGEAAAAWIERDPNAGIQATLFPEPETPIRARKRPGRKRPRIDEAELQSPQATTLDRVHAAMLFQSRGHANALRALIKAEQERGSDFLRLANALSALYPTGTEERRLLEAMLLAVPK